MKALRRLGMESDRFGFVGTRDSEVLNRGSRKIGQFPPPVIGGKIQIRRPHQIADLAPFVRLFDS